MNIADTPSISASKLSWVSSTPFGLPVVPEVYISEAVSSGLMLDILDMTSESSTFSPSEMKLAQDTALG